MNTNEIIHINSRYRKQDCDNLDDSHVCIRLKTGKDIKRVIAVYNDPYIRLSNGEGIFWPSKKMTMKKTGETFNNLYFSCIVPCESHRLKYYFLISDGYEELQYSESGFTNNYAEEDIAMFFVPYISKNNVFQVPSWIEDTIWYQIFPVRFNQNIKGIQEKLEYLKDLGINGLYINPIFKAKSYHKYDVIDYTKIDDELGTEEDLLKLCKMAHDLEMKVMLDISFTHCSNENKMFKDVLEKGEESKYWNYFKVDRNKEGSLIYETFGMMKHMPKFETGNFQVIDYFCNEVVSKWMKLGIDAWRLDVANEINDRFLASLKKIVRNINKESYIVGEIWHFASDWINNESLDGVTNYAFSRAVNAFVAGSIHDIFTYRSKIDELIHSYTPRQLKHNMILLDSHDTPRIRRIYHDDKDKIKLALLLLLTFYGTPSLYYGTERYMDGGPDPDNRRFMSWNENNEDIQDIYHITRLLIKLRKEHKALSNDGYFEWINHDELLIFKRSNLEEELIIVVNSKEYSIDTWLPVQEDYENIINGDQITDKIHMNRLGFMILKRKEW